MVAFGYKGAALSLFHWALVGCFTLSNAKETSVPEGALISGESHPQSLILASPATGPRALHEAYAHRFMAVTQGEASTRAARQMFAMGGNAFDAAAAASFTIAVERPQSTGIGGGGFALAFVASSASTLALDFRETAPKGAHRDLYLDSRGAVIPDQSTDGGLASAVPGMVAGILELHSKYGRLSRETILGPAIALAEKGFPVYPHLAQALKARRDVLAQSPAALAIFFKGRDPNQPLQLGDLVIQKDLAKVLREIAQKGSSGFYEGWVAEALVAEQKKTGGLITREDLRDYRFKYRVPVRSSWGAFEVASMPPPSSGGVHLLQMLNILAAWPSPSPNGPWAFDAVHHTASAMQLAYFDRALYLGDPDFVSVPVKGLIQPSYGAALRKMILPDRILNLEPPPKLLPETYESKETTHLNIADAEGNMIATTQTINGWFGSGVVVQGGGFVMNNQMDDFVAKPGTPNKFGLLGGPQNEIAASKRPLSSMTPTLVFKDRRPIMALGSPSGSQIINCVLLTTLNYLKYKLPLWESVSALRYHHQWRPDTLLVEQPGFPPTVKKRLQKLGYRVEEGDIGCKIQAIAIEEGKLHGVADPRGEGLAAGEEPIPDRPSSHGQEIQHVSED